jgi:hypothetical protein
VPHVGVSPADLPLNHTSTIAPSRLIFNPEALQLADIFSAWTTGNSLSSPALPDGLRSGNAESGLARSHKQAPQVARASLERDAAVYLLLIFPGNLQTVMGFQHPQRNPAHLASSAIFMVKFTPFFFSLTVSPPN